MEAASLIISPTERLELSDIERFSDGSGYCAALTICAGEFSCVRHKFYFSEFVRFIQEFRSAYSRVDGSCELKYRYEPEYIRFSFTSLGHLQIAGLLLESHSRGCRFEFTLETDQSFCPSLIQQLESISKQLHG